TKNGTSYLANPLFEDENRPATLYCTNDESSTYVLLNQSKRSTTFKVPFGNTVYAEYDWYYPACFAGKTMDVYAVGDIYTNGKEYPINKKCGTIDFPSVELTAYSLNLSTDKSMKGFLQLPFSAVRPINQIYAEYFSESETHGLEKSEVLEFENYKTMNGFLKIPATVPHYSMKLCANINVSKWTPHERGKGDPGKYDGDFVTLYSNTFDEKQASNAPMIHAPISFKAENNAEGKVKLSWRIDYLKYPDLFDGDMFQIQRSLTGKEVDFIDIGGVVFDSNEQYYSFVDETLISSLTQADIDPTTGGPHVKYRIRRTCTQMWDWEDNPAADSTECEFTQTLLLQPINARAGWESEELRTVNVEWEYPKNNKYTYYVWDNRAEMVLIMKLTNNNGEVVDSIARKITDAERQNHKMTISLPRSCVNYTMQIKVNKNDSPISCDNFFQVLESNGGSAVKVLDNRTDTYWETTHETGKSAYVVFSTHDPIQFPSGSSIVLYNPDDAETYGSYFPTSVYFYCSDIYKGKFIEELSEPHSNWNILVNSSVKDLPKHNGESRTFRRSTVNDGFHKYFALRLTSDNKQTIRIAKFEIVRPDGTVVQGSNIVTDYTTEVQIPRGYGNFYYNNSGKIDVNSLEWKELQSSIFLEWKMEDPTQAVDRFEILRWEAGTNDTIIVDSNVSQMQFEDKKVSPTRTYYYIVRALTSCEELTYTQTLPNKTAAHCVQTCKVEGYVRFADGTGIPAINVGVTGDGLTEPRQVNTDDNGHYMVDGLPYNMDNGQSASYHISVNGIDSDKLAPECKTGLNVTFDDQGNLKKGFSFTVTSGYKFTGKVMYNGTSIPVKDARIRYCYNKDVTKGEKVTDDEWHEARTSAGAIQTDFEGNFSFYVLGGPMSFQVYKPDHTFYQDGYYYNDFTQNKSGIYFYDDTKVKLIGRVTGGKVQGELPLGNSLSNNNLGDSLQIMMTLEGDNTSYLVFDNTQRSLSERDTVFKHKSYDDKYTYQTRMLTTRHNILIWPDVQTGEYEVMLPPVKWKIQRISAQGYPTLFQDGKVSEVIDLTDSITLHKDIIQGEWSTRQGKKLNEVTVEYNAIYNRIYQAPISLDYKQVGFDEFDYFGDRTYIATDLAGNKVTVPLAYQTKKPNWLGTSKDSMEVHYTFGYPVFNLDRSYPIKITAGEKYYYNNNPNSDVVDIVAVSGVPVTIRNGLAAKGTFNATLHETTDSLDENGEAFYILQAAQQPAIATGEQAVRIVEFSMNLDGVTYVADPLKAYVLDQYSKPGAQNYMSINHPVLVDILRDPPGGGSSAKLSKGSTLKLSYQMDMARKAGTSINFSVGSGMNSFIGTVVGPLGLMAQTGVINQAKTDFNTSIDLIFSGSGQRAFTYTMTASEDITTDGGETMRGADADVYIGVETNLFVKPAVAVRAIPDGMFKKLGGQLKAGRLIEIATGVVGDSTYHLVRDEVLSYGQKLVSNFAHSQKYILNQLVPGLAKQCQSLMLTGTYGEAKTQANRTGKRVYLSLRSTTSDEKFGLLNVDKNGDYIYNSDGSNGQNYTTMDGDYNYLIVLPDRDDDTNTNDDVLNFAESMYHWLNMI
ncbi:MAG: carboxypeptidase regulatory-like domain-containing protein, partial [Prevotella sp.]|nr:carboxypeptidase regulatory-like domain-containing protein [Prevotella sp.]